MIQFDGNNFKFLLQKSVPEDIAANWYSGREESIFSHTKKTVQGIFIEFEIYSILYRFNSLQRFSH